MSEWLRKPLSFGMWLATCLVLGLLFGASTWFVVNAVVDAHDAKNAAARQVEGRAVAIDVLCGFGNGVAEAGRKALAGELRGQRATRVLPESAQRDYVGTITSTLLSEAGITARDVIRPDGEVDCARLRLAAKASGP